MYLHGCYAIAFKTGAKMVKHSEICDRLRKQGIPAHKLCIIFKPGMRLVS